MARRSMSTQVPSLASVERVRVRGWQWFVLVLAFKFGWIWELGFAPERRWLGFGGALLAPLGLQGGWDLICAWCGVGGRGAGRWGV